MPRPGESARRACRSGDPKIDVLTVWIKIVSWCRWATQASYVVHVKTFGAVVVTVRLIDEFLIRKSGPVNAENAPIARHPLHRERAIADYPRVRDRSGIDRDRRLSLQGTCENQKSCDGAQNGSPQKKMELHTGPPRNGATEVATTRRSGLHRKHPNPVQREDSSSNFCQHETAFCNAKRKLF